MLNPSSDFQDLKRTISQSLKSEELGLKVGRIMDSALSAADPFSAVVNGIKKSKIHPGDIQRDQPHPNHRNIIVIGAGKAGQPMVDAVYQFFQEDITAGIVIVKDDYTKNSRLPSQIKVVEASHPLPDRRGVAATQEIIDLLQKADKEDLIICVISGGGSALLTSPVPGITLQDMQSLTEQLLASGATIQEFNTLRKHLDQVKGGQLARIASPARVVSLILSDVVGDPIDIIASGPTVPDPSTYQDAIEILEKYRIFNQIPERIRNHLILGHQGQIDETPKPGENIFANVQNIIVGSNKTAAEAALTQAKLEGFHSLCLTNYLQGEARQAGIFLSSILRQIALHNQPIPRPACIIAGGETTVTLKGNGMGGRNQELALASVIELDGLENIALITLATDGGDGNSDAAGAVVTGETFRRAKSMNLNPSFFLANNDSYNFFLPLEDLIRIGPTMTNVNDLTFLFAY
jgi:glycerate 2-kinase